MNEEIPLDHPRRDSLLTRERIVKGWKDGLVAQAGLIAHGRGEAFDYLIGEKTHYSASKAVKYSALLLLLAEKPIISVNGNTAVLVREELLKLCQVLTIRKGISVPIEINIFYRTPERMKNLINFMGDPRYPEVKILGEKEDARIPGLSSERAKCDKEGIFEGDVIFVPLEDGDRCEALVKMGKIVIAVDLNPLSRTSKKASVTIVDNITRVIPKLIEQIKSLPKNSTQLKLLKDKYNYNNSVNLEIIIKFISSYLSELNSN